MGQTFSHDNNAFIYLDKPFYYGGDLVQGQVLLNCTKAFQCNQVVFKVEGYEKVAWQESTSVTDTSGDEQTTRTEINYCNGYREFFKLSFPLQSFPQYCQPGQYQYPFSFVLPMGMPGTFAFSESYENAEAKIKYKCKVECEVPGITKPNIRYKQYVTVHQRPDRPPSEIKAEHFQEVKACCCAGQGTARMIAHVQKDMYYPGETINVILQVDNQSDADFSRVDVSLEREIKLTANVGRIKISKKEICKVSSEGIPAHTTFMDKDARVISLQLPNEPLSASVHAEVIQCEYRLHLVLKGSGAVSSVKLKVPVTIYVPAPPSQTFAEPPAWWHPTYVAQPLVVQLPSAPPLPPGAQVMAAGGAQPTYAAPPPQ